MKELLMMKSMKEYRDKVMVSPRRYRETPVLVQEENNTFFILHTKTKSVEKAVERFVSEFETIFPPIKLICKLIVIGNIIGETYCKEKSYAWVLGIEKNIIEIYVSVNKSFTSLDLEFLMEE